MSKKQTKFLREKFSGFLKADAAAYYHHLDLRLIDDLNDEGFALIVTHIKGINMLDLNETEITNTSIALLTSLEYVHELRIKGIEAIDNNCIASLNLIKGLTFLHLKGTSITIDGLLQLHPNPILKDLMFSDEENAVTSVKMVQLKTLFPACDFTINSKPYTFEDNYNY
jgi:hypothetical protein